MLLPTIIFALFGLACFVESVRSSRQSVGLAGRLGFATFLDRLSIVEAGHLANEVLRPGTLHAVHLFTK